MSRRICTFVSWCPKRIQTGPWDLKAVPSGMSCTLTPPTMTILPQILLIVIGGLLALAGALLTSRLQIRREQMMLDREDQRAEAERFQAHYGQSIQEKRDAYLAFASAIIAGEFVVHYHLDWSKEQLVNRYNFTETDPGYWHVFGLDQLGHMLTYVAIIAILIS